MLISSSMPSGYSFRDTSIKILLDFKRGSWERLILHLKSLAPEKDTVMMIINIAFGRVIKIYTS